MAGVVHGFSLPFPRVWPRGHWCCCSRAQGWLTAHPDLAGTQQPRPQLVTAAAPQKTITSNTPVTAAAGVNSAAGVARQVTALNAVVDEITAAATAQEGFDRAADGAAADIVRLRNELIKDQMRHIAIVAETTIPDVVRMTVSLRRPRYRDAEGVIASADAMADATARASPRGLLRTNDPA